ncbi:MAG: hypothetical protein R6U63_05720 [Longimicrobiales bacterium]
MIDKRKALTAVALSGLFVAGFMLSGEYSIEITKIPRALAYAPTFDVQSGQQIQLVYVGHSDCPWCNHSDLPGLVDTAKVLLKNRARAHGYGFSAIAVTADNRIEECLGHIEALGRFDAIACGAGWGNGLLLKYVWTADLPALPGTPTLMVYQRNLMVPGESNVDLAYAETDLTRLHTLKGLEAIREWVADGAPLTLTMVRPVLGTPLSVDNNTNKGDGER